MKPIDLNGKVHIINLKFPPEWALMDDDLKENFARQHFLIKTGQEPDNIIAFHPAQHIDLTNCF